MPYHASRLSPRQHHPGTERATSDTLAISHGPADAVTAILIVDDAVDAAIALTPPVAFGR
jgi:hypothetical protein